MLQALGYSKSDIVNEFYDKETFIMIKIKRNGNVNLIQKIIKLKNFSEEIIDANTNKTLIKVGEQINFLVAKKLQKDGLKDICYKRVSLRKVFTRRH